MDIQSGNQKKSSKKLTAEEKNALNRQWYGFHDRRDEFSSSIQEYIEIIYRLSLGNNDDDGWVKNSAISERLAVSAPSVTKMLKKMQEKGLIEWKPRIAVKPTAEGLELARSIIKNHMIVELFFRYVLNLPESDHLTDLICKIEHDLCICIVDAMEKLMGVEHFEEKMHDYINNDITPEPEFIDPVISFSNLKQIINKLCEKQDSVFSIDENELRSLATKLSRKEMRDIHHE